MSRYWKFSKINKFGFLFLRFELSLFCLSVCSMYLIYILYRNLNKKAKFEKISKTTATTSKYMGTLYYTVIAVCKYTYY